MPRKYQYTKVNKLPATALTVSKFAKSKNWKDHSLVYHNIKRGKADYKIVVFQGINFVIP